MTSPPGDRVRTVLLLLLVALAFAEFGARIMLSRRTPGDLASPYVSAARFVHGTNPYDPVRFREDWHALGAGPDEFLDTWGAKPIYPPTALLVISPLALLPWGEAVPVYQLLVCGLYGLLLVMLAGRIGTGWAAPARLLFLSFGLALAPVQTGVRTGNLSVLAFLLCAFSVVLMRDRRDRAAGVLLALGCCLKPTMALSFLFVPILYRRYRMVLAALGAGAAVAVSSFARMLTLPPAWRSDYGNNVALLFAPTGVASFTESNASRFDLLNFEVPVYALSHSVLLTDLLCWGLAIGLAAFAVIGFRRSRVAWEDDRSFWIAVAIFALLGMIPIYQRTYNGGLILFAVFWCFRNFRGPAAKIALCCCTIFLLPGQALLRGFVVARLPPAVRDGYLWNGFLLPHANWAIVMTAVSLVWLSLRPMQSPDTKST